MALLITNSFTIVSDAALRHVRINYTENFMIDNAFLAI